MQIRIEIDVKPEELRRFLGLPDVAGLQEDVIQFLREKVGAASESFDPATFVKDNLQTLRHSAAWQKIVASTKRVRAAEPAATVAPAKGKVRRKPGVSKRVGARSPAKRGAAKSADDAA
ncbi:MAG: hypothetical protein JWR16_1694 [Nevskia sp.]|nr:hypothetical protein [Nevskia sp.]